MILQGLHFVSAKESAPCFVYPTPHSFQDGIDIENALESGVRTFEDVDIALVVPLSQNSIRDACFAPDEVAEYCDRYEWARIERYIVGKSLQQWFSFINSTTNYHQIGYILSTILYFVQQKTW